MRGIHATRRFVSRDKREIPCLCSSCSSCSSCSHTAKAPSPDNEYSTQQVQAKIGQNMTQCSLGDVRRATRNYRKNRAPDKSSYQLGFTSLNGRTQHGIPRKTFSFGLRGIGQDLDGMLTKLTSDLHQGPVSRGLYRRDLAWSFSHDLHVSKVYM